MAGTADESLLPKDIPFAEHGVLTELEVQGGYLGATVIGTTPIVELYPPIARAVLDAGYEIFASDNEGFEAEIFFRKGEVDGAYRMREGPCGDLVTIKLLIGGPQYEGDKENG